MRPERLRDFLNAGASRDEGNRGGRVSVMSAPDVAAILRGHFRTLRTGLSTTRRG